MTVRLHPLTGVPLEPVGYVRGRAVWPILGGSEGVPEGAPAGQPATPPAQPPAQPAAPVTAPPPAPAAPAPQPPAQPATPKAVEVGDNDDAAALLAKYTPEELAAYALTLRKENTRGRTGAKAAAADQARTELAQHLAKALGLTDDDDAGKVTPEQLTADLTAARDQARTAAVQLELYRTAAQHGAVAGDLLSLVVLRDTAGLDPAAPDFRDKVVAAAQAAVQANPILRAAPAAAKSGGEFTGGPGGTSKPTTLEEAVQLKMGATA